MEIVKCKRCNRILKNKLSIERGFGETCYRIFKLNKVDKPKVELEVNSEIAFLKIEIKTLKRMIRNIQINGSSVKPIERKKQIRPEQKITGNEANYGNVMKEMKEIFSNVKSVKDYLRPINPIEEIIAPPILVLI